ncbi:uncharacterized protein LOC107789765 [Nicotiana tabacum]|uniref:uncharacterized protein LOC107789765 n=1 Tax=Nicotiana tabacum TaxID=4097 RepID=UPI003F4EB80C
MVVSWEDFKVGLHSRYGANQYIDFFGELTKLQQQGTVKEYQVQFETLLAKVGLLSTERQVSCFISGLKDLIRTEVLANRPATLSAAISLARLYEAKVSSQRKLAIPIKSNLQQPSRSVAGTSPSPTPIKKLSLEELNERRRLGLCFRFNDKYGPGHKCKQLFFIQAIIDTEDDKIDMEIEDSSSPDLPRVSIHAIDGICDSKTMKIMGRLKDKTVMVLLDSGSSHNFVNDALAIKIGLQLVPGKKFDVMVASGERLTSMRRCKQVCLNLQGNSFRTDFYLLPLEGYDVVLGTQWLRMLGPIVWDFCRLEMRFQIDDKETLLWGIKKSDDQIVDNYQMEKITWKRGQGILLQLQGRQQADPPSVVMPEIQQLLERYRSVLREPCGLPPSRTQDHRIPLLEGQHPISLRTYRYPHYQKGEIKKIVAEILRSEVIRPSTSPYSSPVILVKKQDGSWRMCVDYRALNKVTIKDKFPIPVIDELLDELHGASFFTKLDLRSGYHQIRVHPSDIEKIAFRTHQGHYEFLVMPFGLTNAPSTFQSLMNEVFKKYLRKFILVFFYDTLIYSKDWDEHMKHLELVFSILKHHQLFVKMEKCQFGQREVRYLGHVISNQGVVVDPEKIEVVMSWPKPTNPKAMRGFLGLLRLLQEVHPEFWKNRSSSYSYVEK